MVYKKFKKWFLASETSRFYQDFIQGVSIVRDFLVLASEQAFMEMERIRLQHRLVRINKKLSYAYRRLGEQGLDCLEMAAPSAERPLPLEPIYQQIEDILKDQKRVLAEIEQMVSETPTAEGEIKHVE